MLSGKKVDTLIEEYLEKDQILSNPGDVESKRNIWRSILEVILKDREDILYKRDENGDIIYNDRGYPKVNIISVILHLSQLIAGLVVQFELEKRLKLLK